LSSAKAPKLPWKAYLEALGAKGVTAINVNSVAYFEELSAAFAELKPATLSTYLTWNILRGSVNALPKAFQDATFAYTSQALSGAKEDRPRWKKCVGATDGLLGEALGREFVKRHFGEDGKARTNAMVEALQKSVEKNLASLAWFDEPTRAAALVKVKKMVGNNKVGYPNVWRDYAKLSTSRGSFFTNAQAAIRFEAVRQLAKIGKPLDRNEWLMSPPTVNAYYDGQKNEIVFQPPFFNKDATDAINFGAMGMVVGHEITHGFDDEGRQFDADGNLKDWWTKDVGDAFVKKASCVKRQYDGYTAIEDIKVKGDLTLGENVADLGGLKLSHQAMLDWYAAKGVKDTSRFTPSQQFFLGYGQSWCTKLRPEVARVRAGTDPHSPPYWRVNGPLGNLAAFKEAFQCADTAAMVRSGEQRCEVW
jgi:endothelin-converting enzyme/putative endopeptidase